MTTKLFIVAIVVLGIAVVAGLFVSLNRADTTVPAATDDNTQKTYTVADVKQHNSKQSCWTIISGSVYDITSYIPRHPGGEEILRACGIDATRLFTTRTSSDGETVGSGTPHSSNADDQLRTLKIGALSQ
ncbi:MAG: cytochrome b5-like heme/steroid binding domain-containing protein [Candidatus Saccharimonadales bacterium]